MKMIQKNILDITINLNILKKTQSIVRTASESVLLYLAKILTIKTKKKIWLNLINCNPYYN